MISGCSGSFRTLKVTQAQQNAAKIKYKLKESSTSPLPEIKKMPDISPIASPTHSMRLKIARKIIALNKVAKIGDKVVVITPALPALPKFIA